MSEYLYIISNYKFKKHFSLENARAEMRRLKELFPNDVFRIYTVKSGLLKDGSKAPKDKKQDKSTDYKNPSNQKGILLHIPEKKLKISLDNFKGKLISRGE